MLIIEFDKLREDELWVLANQPRPAGTPEWEMNIWTFLRRLIDPNIAEFEIFTSGSTGTPRAIRHTRTALFNSANATCKYLNIAEGATAWLCLPANRIAGMMMIVRGIANKMKLICTPPSSNPFNDLDTRYKIDFCALTPMQFHAISQSYQLFKKADDVGCIILGGSEIPRGLNRYILDLKAPIYATYGMTETISHIALKRLNGKQKQQHYHLLPGVSLKVDDRGCAVINAPVIEVVDLHTNDIVQIFENGSFDWVGRIDNVINTGGIKVYPEQMEDEMRERVLVPFFIAGIPDARLGQKVVMAIERENITEKEMGLLVDYLRDKSETTRPRELLLVPHFIRTSNGKLKRTESLTRFEKSILL